MNNQRAWIIGGATLVGLGIGFVFLQQSALYFVASILIGIGVGLLIASILPAEKE
jgi:hypothetical protein